MGSVHRTDLPVRRLATRHEPENWLMEVSGELGARVVCERAGGRTEELYRGEGLRIKKTHARDNENNTNTKLARILTPKTV